MAGTKAAISATELRALAMEDSSFYCKTFFPDTYRQAIPEFHLDIWDLLEDRQHRHVGIMVYRGGAKTTLLRTFTSKRIAFGISRTIVFVSAAQEHSRRSVAWIRKRVERPSLWKDVFQLEPGRPWTDDVCEIKHNLLNITITLIALGITGQIRGVNVDDYRPDLIVIDDAADEESTATEEGRKKLDDLIFGSLDNSLSPESESPDAKMVMLQTPLQQDDPISKVHRDPTWASRRYSCFDDNGRSRWEDRYSTASLQTKKDGYVARNQVSLWLREMECLLIGAENAYFKAEWLQEYDLLPTEPMAVFLGIDPVPPPTDLRVAKGLADRDFECLFVLGRTKSEFYALEYVTSRGHTPEWTANEFFRLLDRWRPLRARVETVNYQATLKWYLEQEMRKRGRFLQVDADDTKRKKSHLIRQAYSGVASQRRLFIRREMRELREQFVTYPFCPDHDDVLNAGALALEAAQGIEMDLGFEPAFAQVEEPLGEWRWAP